MFWVAILIICLLTIGLSVLIGLALKRRNLPRVGRNEMLALKSSGALHHRKENMR